MSDRTIIRGLIMPSFEHACGRLEVFSLTRNGPELDVCASELGPDQHLYERRG